MNLMTLEITNSIALYYLCAGAAGAAPVKTLFLVGDYLDPVAHRTAYELRRALLGALLGPEAVAGLIERNTLFFYHYLAHLDAGDVPGTNASLEGYVRGNTGGLSGL